jgi:sporulation integral membrane protein YlbJ
MQGGSYLNQKFISLLYAICIFFIAFSIIYFPQSVLSASKRGLEMWATVVFPSLLPFFIIAELFIAFGIVHFIGVLFEPIMRPLFNVPGVGGFVWAMGMASGYPAGAKFTARLRQENQLTKIEAERLVSFTNASNPLFIIGAVSIGFFYDQQLGILLAITHYLSNFFVGLCMRFYKKEKKISVNKSKLSFKKAFTLLHEIRIKDNRPLGKKLGDAITQSIHTLLLIGGFIVLFSVLTTVLKEIHLTEIVSSLFANTLPLIHLPKEFAVPLFTGLFEITIGAQELSTITSQHVLFYAIILSFILGFNGLSVQAQVASILAETDIQFYPYFIARILHGTIAATLVTILYPILYVSKESHTTIATQENHIENTYFQIFVQYDQLNIMITIICLLLYVILILNMKELKL